MIEAVHGRASPIIAVGVGGWWMESYFDRLVDTPKNKSLILLDTEC